MGKGEWAFQAAGTAPVAAQRSVKQPAVQAGRNEEHLWGSTGLDLMGVWTGGADLYPSGPGVPQRPAGGMYSDSACSSLEVGRGRLERLG